MMEHSAGKTRAPAVTNNRVPMTKAMERKFIDGSPEHEVLKIAQVVGSADREHQVTG